MPPVLLETVIAGWMLLEDISVPGSVRCRYMAENTDGERGVFTLYNAEGAEPDPDVYDELRRLSLDHIPQIFDVGRYEGRAYEVTEYIVEGNLIDLQVAVKDYTRHQLAAVEEEIAPLANDWLASKFEDSPFQVLCPFDWDTTTIDAFKNDFIAFIDAETARSAYIREHSPAFDTADPEALHIWRQTQASRFRNLEDDTRNDLKRWSLLFFQDGSRRKAGSDLLERSNKILDDLIIANADAHRDEFHALLCDMSATRVQE